MPRCASDQPMGGYVRSAEVGLKVGIITRKVNLAGIAEAYFPDRTDDYLKKLRPGDEFSMVWQDSIFHGIDSILGPITMNLLKGQQNPITSGMVRSQAPAINPFDEIPNGIDFFPAVNRNNLFFEFKLHRFGIVLRNEEPIINESIIKEIPPYHSIYNLIKPVKFNIAKEKSGFMGKITPPVEIQTCNVKLLIIGGMTVNLTLLREDDKNAEFEIVATNESDSEEVNASWMIWPRPEIDEQNAIGQIKLNEQPVKFNIKINRDIFFRDRWIVLAGATPFENNAAAAMQFPPLS